MSSAAARAALLFALVACRDRPPAAPPPRADATAAARDATDAAPIDRAAALALVETFECNRCHDGTGLPAAPQDKHCVACHRAIRDGTFAAAPADLATWRAHATSLLVAPSLAHARRLRRAWIEAFLLHPIEVRPGLPASMPRLAIAPAQAALLAAYLAPDDPLAAATAAAAAGDPVRGAQLYAARGCPSCHAFTGAAVPAASGPAIARSADAAALAPDLALTRVRMAPVRVAAWIAAPAPDSLMPRLGLTDAEAQDLAAFVVQTPLPAAAPPPPPEPRLPVLTRAIGFDEVAERVFRKVCWHCHAQPDYARGDGGPGNTGGFGFAPRGLDLSSYEGAASGSRGDDGKRRGIFAPLPDGTPRVIAHLMARRREVRGEQGPVRGMPLGFPPLSLEDIQLVESWIAQGRPE